MSTTEITWKWGSNTDVNFNPKTDVLDFGWFQAGQFKVSELKNSILISIPSNDQTYTIKGITLKDLTMSNIVAKDDGARKFWLDLINGGQPAPDPEPPKPDPQPDPEPVPPGPAPDPEPPKPDPQPDPDPIPPSTGKLFSPYIDLGLYASKNFPSMCVEAGIKAITLAFLVGQGNSLRWGGNGGQIEEFKDQIKDAQSNGIEVTVSFGGATGVDPAVSYDNAQALANDLQKVINMGVNRLDFDIEASNVGNVSANKRRGEALSIVRKNNPNVFISFTIAVLPSGLTSEGVDIVRHAKEYGFDVDAVYVMAMDYCQRVSDMGQAAIDAGNNTLKQIRSLGLNKAFVGIIPMIGCNDSYRDYGEVFTLDNAKQVLDYAKKNDFINYLGIWSMSRDNGNAPIGEASYGSSGLRINNWDFCKIFKNL